MDTTIDSINLLFHYKQYFRRAFVALYDQLNFSF